MTPLKKTLHTVYHPTLFATYMTDIQFLLKKIFLKYLFIGCTMWQYGILDPRTGIEPVPPVLDTQSLTHWTAREDP